MTGPNSTYAAHKVTNHRGRRELLADLVHPFALASEQRASATQVTRHTWRNSGARASWGNATARPPPSPSPPRPSCSTGSTTTSSPSPALRVGSTRVKPHRRKGTKHPRERDESYLGRWRRREGPREGRIGRGASGGLAVAGDGAGVGGVRRAGTAYSGVSRPGTQVKTDGDETRRNHPQRLVPAFWRVLALVEPARSH